MANTAELSAIADRCYADAPISARLLLRYRPYICPFDMVVDCFPRGASVLDIGCGGGLTLLFAGLLRDCRAGVGVDTSLAAIAAAKQMSKRLNESNPKMQLTFQSVGNDPSSWPDRTFDVVSMIDVLHHVPPSFQKSFFLAAAQRVNESGRLVYKDMCERPLWRALANRLHDLVIARQWIHYVPVRTVEEWAEEGGFRVTTRQDTARLWYGHELRVFTRV